MKTREEYLQKCSICKEQPTFLIPIIKQQSEDFFNMTEEGYICLDCVARKTFRYKEDEEEEYQELKSLQRNNVR